LKNGNRIKTSIALAALFLAAGCGTDSAPLADSTSLGTSAIGAPAPSAVSASPTSLAAIDASGAARFLNQATFGPTADSIAALSKSSYEAWIDTQLKMPLGQTAVAYLESPTRNPKRDERVEYFYSYFWREAVTAPDQLRQRATFSLSQIFVVSFASPRVTPRGMASYYDMLNRNAFGNYRTLLEDVALHPMMGLYLSHLGNQKENAATGQNPDQNFAREILQLMSIGLFELNLDGTAKLDANGDPIPTYSQDDIIGLSKVFTGFSWQSPKPSLSSFLGNEQTINSRFGPSWVSPMIPYPSFHSTSEKKFLGVTIPASSQPDATGDLKMALDTIFNHPNVAPFISRQYIQRLVTSNPSPDYVRRVAQVFNDNGQGVRGDLAAVIRAVLLDREARNPPSDTDRAFGKLREPILRYTNVMRAFRATSQSGLWMMTSTSSSLALAQAPLAAPSVFNFYRPNYTPSNTAIAKQGMVAPEFQIADEITVASYVNQIRTLIEHGVGTNFDIRLDLRSYASIAHDPAALAESMNFVLLNGRMSPKLRQRIIQTVSDSWMPRSANARAADIEQARMNRARIAVFLTMISPEYLIQR
jgi:uncharacterized protein (DUF1800 family)